MSASFCMNGISSRRRSSGVSEVKYFSRKIEARSSWVSALIRSKRRRSVRRMRESLLADVVSPSINRNTAANTTTRNPITTVAFMVSPGLASIGQSEHAHGQTDAPKGNTLVECRYHASGSKATQNISFGIDAGTAESENLRHGD